jgi:hypothetical protein
MVGKQSLDKPELRVVILCDMTTRPCRMDDVPANSDISPRKSKSCLQAKERQIIAWSQAEPEGDVAFVDCGGGSNEDYST